MTKSACQSLIKLLWNKFCIYSAEDYSKCFYWEYKRQQKRISIWLFIFYTDYKIFYCRDIAGDQTQNPLPCYIDLQMSVFFQTVTLHYFAKYCRKTTFALLYFILNCQVHISTAFVNFFFFRLLVSSFCPKNIKLLTAHWL
jgi:hypothetical protein